MGVDLDNSTLHTPNSTLKYKEDFSMNILVTGGAGYIGSHTCVELLESGYGVVIIDNLCNSNPKSMERVEELTGKKVKFYEGDVRDV